MRILHCLRAPVGGLFRHVLDLAAEQAARGHEVGILADSNAEDRLTLQKFAHVTDALRLGIMRIPMSRAPGIGDYRAYKNVLGKVRPLGLDVLHGHGAKGGAYARLAARTLKREGQTVRAFYTPHGGSLNFNPGSIEGRIILQLERILERYTDGLIFESAHASRVYRERVGMQFERSRIIPNGLQPGDFEPPRLRQNATDFLFIGELRSIKGVDVLLQALSQLSGHSKVTATIVGSGAEEKRLRALSAELGLSDRVNFTGALPIGEALTLGRIMVVPSLKESFPYVVLEAAAAGLPLVSTSVGGIPEIVAETDTQLIPAGDARALADAMYAALAHPEVAAARASRLKANVQNKFTVAAMTSAVLEFYEFTQH